MKKHNESSIFFILLIFIAEITPVSRHLSETGADGLTNENANRFNLKLCETAKQKNCHFVPVSDSLKVAGGCLRTEVLSDGQHLNCQYSKIPTNSTRKYIIGILRCADI